MALVVEVYLVSILVLMDITLILKSYYEGNIVWKCFNPCFNGYYTYTNYHLSLIVVMIYVSILVLMDITLILYN